MFLALLLRLGLLLSATPVGAMQREILYVRAPQFVPIVRLAVGLLVLEAVQMLLPTLVGAAALDPAYVVAGGGLIDLVQAVMLVLVAALTLRAFGPYSRRSLEELEVFARRGVEAIARRVRPARPQRTPRRGA